MTKPPIIVVTGAAAGIGAAVVAHLNRAGALVVSVDRAPATDDSVDFVQADLSDPGSIEAAVLQLPPRIDGLCNVAGVSGVGGADLTIRVNFLGLRKLTVDLGDRLARGSSVVNVGSFAGVGWPARKAELLTLARTRGFDEGLAWLERHPVPDDSAYPYSKEVLRVWSQMLAARWVERGIRVNVVNPGPVETAILTEFVQVLGEEKVGDDIGRAGRAGTADDIASAIAWLALPESRWVNGADLPVDGGLAASFFEENK